MPRPLLSESPFAALVRSELERARGKHDTPIRSPHEGYAVVLEELDEVWDEVKKPGHRQDLGKVREELVQVAAMCQRMAEDLGLVEGDS